MNTDFVKGKAVLVYGLGITGLSSCEVLNRLGAKVYTYEDHKEDEKIQLKGEKANRKELPKGVRRLSDIDQLQDMNFAFLLKSPGIRLDKPILQKAREINLPIYSDIEIAYQLFGGDRMISVTGSNGKTTAVTLISHILNQGGKSAISVGNIGVPILSSMLNAGPDTYFVVECSSFQLSSVDLFKPHIAAILNISPDHLEWHDSFDQYMSAKFKLATKQGKEDYLILNPHDANTLDFLETHDYDSQLVWIPLEGDLAGMLRQHRHWKLFGEHNVENALFAVEACRLVGLDDYTILQGLDSFEAVKHRMEIVKKVNGVRYINDSKATNVDATVKAISGLHDPYILIAGGYDKKVHFNEMLEAFKKGGRLLILIGETKYQIAKEAEDMGLSEKVIIKEDLRSALNTAQNMAEDGDIVLLSPASASWDQYPNFEARGDEFRNLVNSIAEVNNGRRT